MRIAIVNRGEAALRLIRAVRELRAERGEPLETLALVTPPDRGARFARQADRVVELALAPGQGAAAAYLDAKRLVSVMTAAGADAVWVGWGFLAEDASFAQRCEDAGLLFIGPGPKAMALCGDKVAAKGLAERCQVPVVPWSGRPLENAEEIHAVCEAIGFPLILKAAGGGGGRGIRRVDSPEGLGEAFEAATGEAARAFGDGRVFVERCITRARHLEVQVAFDAAGHGLAYGVRDCTVQRRHQKVIEECPGPHVLAGKVAQLERWALAFAREAGYRNVGTVEFIVDLSTPEATPYFMEMNARLQVEHPVTEVVYGLDLVKLQLDLAAGLALPTDPPRPRGAAIEVRLNAEDPTRDFAPSPGTVVRFDMPQGPGIRVDSGVAAGAEIPADFDSNIAKIIAWGRNRAEALARMRRALDETAVLVKGGATNKALLAELCTDAAFVEGTLDTGWLDRREAPTGRPLEPEAYLVAAVLDYRQERERELRAFFSAATRGVPQRLPSGDPRRVKFAGDLAVTVCCVGYRRYRANGVAIELLEDEPGTGSVTVDGRPHRLLYHLDPAVAAVELDGVGHRVGRDTGGVVRAPAPAMIMSVAVAEGQRVRQGERLASLEAMKMEMPLLAPRSGRVGQIQVVAGSQVAAGQVILTLEADKDPSVSAESPRHRVTLPHAADALEAREALTPRLLETRIERVMLGYDVSTRGGERLLAVLDDSRPWPETGSALAWAKALVTGLRAFVDIEHLFADELLVQPGGGPRSSLSSGFYEFVGRPSAAAEEQHPELVSALGDTLRHYGVTSLEPDAPLRHALARIAVAHGRQDARTALRHRLVSSILRRLMRLHRDGANLAAELPVLGPVLEELPIRAQRRWPFVLDNTMQCRAVLYEQPRAEVPVDELLRAEAIDRLVENPRSMFQTLLEATQGPYRQCAALALFRRMYHAPVRSAAVQKDNGALVVGLHLESGRQVLGLVTTSTQLRDTLDDLFWRLARADGGRFVDLVVHRAGPAVTAEGLRTDVAAALADAPLAARARLERLCLIVDEGHPVVRHVTFEPGDGRRFAERVRLRDLHPEMATKLELWRLSNFDLVRQASHDRLVCYRAVAKTNPRDERIVIVGEVRDVPVGEVLDAAPAALLAFEQAFIEATGALRELQWRRARRARYLNNSIILHVRPVVSVERAEVERLAERLARYTGGLGLERVVVRAKVATDGTVRDRELRITNPTGHGLQLQITEPSPGPWPAASSHELKARKARALGIAYPYEVIEMLVGHADGPFGAGSFQELDLGPEDRAVPVDRAPGENQAGVVFGMITHHTAKHPEGMRRVIVLSDPLRAMGALSEPECRRINAALTLAASESLPVEWLATSAGALISMDSGTENLDWTARTLRQIIEFTEAGGTIHVIINGVNVGAQSYFNAEATMLMHTRGALIMTPRGSLVLTGKKALDYSGGVSAEDERGIGGYERIMGGNGQAQYFAKDLGDAFRTLMALYELSYVAPGERGVRRRPTTDPAGRDVTGEPEVGRLFSRTHNPERKKPFEMRALMAAVKDRDSRHLERFADMRHADTAVVWDTHLGGRATSLIGIESRPIPRRGWVPGDGPETWTGGTLFPRSSKKLARALRAASGVRPVVVLANLSGFDGSPESMRRLQLEYGAEIGRAVTQFEGRIVFCVVARYHGGAYVVFSKALNPNLIALAVDGAYASVIGGAPAAAVVFPREVQAKTAADVRVVEARAALNLAPDGQRPRLREALARLEATVYGEKQAEVAREFDRVHSVERALKVGSLDAIIPAAELRPRLIEALEHDSRLRFGASPRSPARGDSRKRLK